MGCVWIHGSCEVLGVCLKERQQSRDKSIELGLEGARRSEPEGRSFALPKSLTSYRNSPSKRVDRSSRVTPSDATVNLIDSPEDKNWLSRSLSDMPSRCSSRRRCHSTLVST